MIIYDKMIIQLLPSRLIIKQVTLDFEKVLWLFRTQDSPASCILSELRFPLNGSCVEEGTNGYLFTCV